MTKALAIPALPEQAQSLALENHLRDLMNAAANLGAHVRANGKMNRNAPELKKIWAEMLDACDADPKSTDMNDMMVGLEAICKIGGLNAVLTNQDMVRLAQERRTARCRKDAAPAVVPK